MRAGVCMFLESSAVPYGYRNRICGLPVTGEYQIDKNAQAG
jgi:hypothetical protein